MPEDLAAYEAEAVSFHERQCADALKLWRESLSLYMRSLDPLNGHKQVPDREGVQIGMLITSLNSLMCAYDLAIRGYYVQSLNLMRPPVEYAMAFIYVENFPDQALRFMDPAKPTPRFSGMKKRLEREMGRGKLDSAEQWLDLFHAFSHVDAKVMAMIVKRTTGKINYTLGPDTNELTFRATAERAIAIATLMTEAISHLRTKLGYPNVSELFEFVEEFNSWRAGVLRSWSVVTIIRTDWVRQWVQQFESSASQPSS